MGVLGSWTPFCGNAWLAEGPLGQVYGTFRAQLAECRKQRTQEWHKSIREQVKLGQEDRALSTFYNRPLFTEHQ